MDLDGNLYAFPYKRLSYGNNTWVLDERYRRWKVDLGEYPQTAITIGSDGYILAGMGGSNPVLLIVRPDGTKFSSWALDHSSAAYVTTDASRVIYVATDTNPEGHLYRFTQFCDTFVNPDVCPYNSWVETTIAHAFNTPPILLYGSLYVAFVDHTLYKFNKNTLALEASFTADSAIRNGPIATPNGDILVVSSSGTMYSLTKNLATVRWQKTLGIEATYGIPAASGNAIYLAFDGYLRAYNPSSGALLWKRSIGSGHAYVGVSVGYGREVYIQGVQGKVMAFGEGWGVRPARLIVTPGISAVRSRQFMAVEILQNVAPISVTVASEPALLAPDENILVEGENGAEWVEAVAADLVAVLLQRSEDGGPWEDVVLLDPGTTIYTDTNVTANLGYQYRVQNLMSDGSNSDFETTLDVVQSLPDVPAAPTLDSATALSAEAIELAWTPTASSVIDQYVVERSVNIGGPFTPVITITGESLTTIDNDLAPGSTAYYRMRAANSSGQSAASNVVNATTHTQNLSAPQNFQAVLNGSSEIHLTWTPGPAGTTAVIEIITFGETEYSVLTTVAADAGTFNFPNGEPGAYDFRIKYVLGSDESPYAYSNASVVIIESITVYLPLIVR